MVGPRINEGVDSSDSAGWVVRPPDHPVPVLPYQCNRIGGTWEAIVRQGLPPAPGSVRYDRPGGRGARNNDGDPRILARTPQRDGAFPAGAVGDHNAPRGRPFAPSGKKSRRAQEARLLPWKPG